MKKVFMILCFIILCQIAFAEEINNTQTIQNPLTVPQDITFENCTKIFGINQEKLFYLTLASISANRFNIEEIQTECGYIIFSVNRNRYLASVSKVDNKDSILKITPCNNVYRFPPGILSNTFKYIDINLGTDLKG